MSAPVGGDPDAAVVVVHPAGADPDGAGMRAGGPVATVPNPMATPFPAAGSPEPHVQRTGGDGDNFHLRRGRFAGVGHDDFAGRNGHGTVTINNFAFHTAGKQREGGADQSTLDDS